MIACLIFAGCDGGDKEAERLAEYNAKIDQAFADIRTAEAKYDYAKATSIVDQIEADLRSADLNHATLDIRVGNEIGRVYEARRQHDRLMAEGYVIFEGKRMSSEQWSELIRERKESEMLAELKNLYSGIKEVQEARKLREQNEEKALKEVTRVLDERVKFDFRRATWGMTRAEVRATEDASPVSSDDRMLVYSVNLNRVDAYCAFVFVDDKLVRGTYGITDVHLNPIEYLQDCKQLIQLLSLKYGAPTRDESFWVNDVLRDDLNSALALGYVSFETEWKDDRTRVFLQLSNENGKVILRLDYTHIASEPAMRAAEVADSLDGL